MHKSAFQVVFSRTHVTCRVLVGDQYTTSDQIGFDERNLPMRMRLFAHKIRSHRAPSLIDLILPSELVSIISNEVSPFNSENRWQESSFEFLGVSPKDLIIKYVEVKGLPSAIAVERCVVDDVLSFVRHHGVFNSAIGARICVLEDTSSEQLLEIGTELSTSVTEGFEEGRMAEGAYEHNLLDMPLELRSEILKRKILAHKNSRISYWRVRKEKSVKLFKVKHTATALYRVTAGASNLILVYTQYVHNRICRAYRSSCSYVQSLHERAVFQLTVAFRSALTFSARLNLVPPNTSFYSIFQIRNFPSHAEKQMSYCVFFLRNMGRNTYNFYRKSIETRSIIALRVGKKSRCFVQAVENSALSLWALCRSFSIIRISNFLTYLRDMQINSLKGSNRFLGEFYNLHLSHCIPFNSAIYSKLVESLKRRMYYLFTTTMKLILVPLRAVELTLVSRRLILFTASVISIISVGFLQFGSVMTSGAYRGWSGFETTLDSDPESETLPERFEGPYVFMEFDVKHAAEKTTDLMNVSFTDTTEMHSPTVSTVVVREIPDSSVDLPYYDASVPSRQFFVVSSFSNQSLYFKFEKNFSIAQFWLINMSGGSINLDQVLTNFDPYIMSVGTKTLPVNSIDYEGEFSQPAVFSTHDLERKSEVPLTLSSDDLVEDSLASAKDISDMGWISRVNQFDLIETEHVSSVPFVRPKPRPRDFMVGVDVIVDSLRTAKAEPIPTEIESLELYKATAPDGLRILGIVGTESRRRALVALEDGRTAIVSAGTSISSGRILRVERDRILIETGSGQYVVSVVK
jgi:hypothetical protein